MDDDVWTECSQAIPPMFNKNNTYRVFREAQGIFDAYVEIVDGLLSWVPFNGLTKERSSATPVEATDWWRHIEDIPVGITHKRMTVSEFTP